MNNCISSFHKKIITIRILECFAKWVGFLFIYLFTFFFMASFSSLRDPVGYSPLDSSEVNNDDNVVIEIFS